MSPRVCSFSLAVRRPSLRDSRLLNDDYGVFHDSEQESSHQEEAKVDEKKTCFRWAATALYYGSTVSDWFSRLRLDGGRIALLLYSTPLCQSMFDGRVVANVVATAADDDDDDRGDADAADDCCSTTCQLSIDILIITCEPCVIYHMFRLKCQSSYSPSKLTTLHYRDEIC